MVINYSTVTIPVIHGWTIQKYGFSPDELNSWLNVAPDDYQRSLTKVLRTLTEGQMHSINEFEHLKKAIDLLTMQLFDAQNKINS